jgi:hypothetical protein
MSAQELPTPVARVIDAVNAGGALRSMTITA